MTLVSLVVPVCLTMCNLLILFTFSSYWWSYSFYPYMQIWLICPFASMLCFLLVSFLCSECWVLHSTDEYAARIISMTGLRKPSNDILAKVAEELFQEFQTIGPYIPRPLFMKAHRWYSSWNPIKLYNFH